MFLNYFYSRYLHELKQHAESEDSESEPSVAVTRKAVDAVHTRTTVLARAAGTLVYVDLTVSTWRKREDNEAVNDEVN